MTSEAKPYEQVMTCGHAANSIETLSDGSRLPACVICSCNTPAPDQPNLEGRKARCAYYGKDSSGMRNRGSCPTRTREDQTCRCEEPSSHKLWFFEYRGPGGSEERRCAVCGFHAVAHEPINPATGRPRHRDQAHEFVPREPAEFDKFYCSCFGDD